MYAPAPAAWRNAYLDSASLHLGRGFRHMHKKKGKVFWNASIPQPFPLFFHALLNA